LQENRLELENLVFVMVLDEGGLAGKLIWVVAEHLWQEEGLSYG